NVHRTLFAGLLVFMLVGVLLASTSAGAPPPIRGADDQTVEATSSAGATVSWQIKAFDPTSGNPISATCTPGGSGSGSFQLTADFPIGATPVHCEATLENGSTASADFTVTVRDTQPPAFGSVSDVTASTTNPGGTAVTYASPVATDVVDGAITGSCSPASGSTFSVGTTQVNCSATDAHGNTG